jgi:hypothetical protein
MDTDNVRPANRTGVAAAPDRAATMTAAVDAGDVENEPALGTVGMDELPV